MGSSWVLGYTWGFFLTFLAQEGFYPSAGGSRANRELLALPHEFGAAAHVQDGAGSITAQGRSPSLTLQMELVTRKVEKAESAPGLGRRGCGDVVRQ